ncbi:hypothetical protein [Geosporobacter ferrireducens]|uniref:Uncharacterized protein n=1 Tax=Geosporobacter ferrireducens TaxID=1424294 RepID=A0A1D8GPA0_9FIRM|nr:hypothetical protein [Geosporobacter ferrireducens]AOT72723.1 hypothetical protein Gferi_26090 [Geosporobacter ferrireducens]MTI55133.1 hypothetical protein [Geosporobacter ferrireducens]
MQTSKKMDLVYKVLKQSPELTPIDLVYLFGLNDSAQELLEIYENLSNENQRFLIGYARKFLETEKSEATS